MAAREAEQAETVETDEELREDVVPGDSSNVMLIAADSYENLDIENAPAKKKSHIHEIVRHGSKDQDDSHDSSSGTELAPGASQPEANHSGAQTASEDSEDQSDTSITKDLSEAIESISQTQQLEKLAQLDDEEDDDVKTPEWRQQRKHVFILSDSGKPVYSRKRVRVSNSLDTDETPHYVASHLDPNCLQRYGNEDKLVTIFGVMQALVSFVQDSSHDTIKSIIVGEHRVVFLHLEHLILVCVSRGSESDKQIRMQLNYLYNQVLSVLTLSSLRKIFKQRRNYDLRRQLSGSEKFLDNLLNMMDHEPGLLLSAVRCLPLESATRDMIAQSIVQCAKVKDLVFALIIANSHLVTLVRMKKYFLHPMDLHIIINLINAAESFKAAESWTPICLPKFDSTGFLQAHISYLDEECQTCLLLLSVDRDCFFTLSECRNKIKERLIKYNGLKAISDSLRKDSYNIQKCGISDLRHFLYKNKSTAQYTSPELEAPYLTPDQQERLFGLYHYLHNRIHSSSRPLKILYHVGQYEALLGWVTQGFELYAVFGPLVTKSLAINAINKLMNWIRKEAERLFILNSVTF